jgi:hypothetical protein
VVAAERGSGRRRLEAVLTAVADVYESKYGHHMTSPDGTWHGLGTGIRSGDVLLYRIDPVVGSAFGKGVIYRQTRYRFQR